MARNPYVTVPAGTAAQQALWVQAYYRNLALQNQYDQQPDWGDALAKGLNQGVGLGLNQYFGMLDNQTKFQQAQDLQSQQDYAQAERQRALIEQQNVALAERERAAAEAEQRKAILAQIMEQRKQANVGTAYQQFYAGVAPTTVPQPDVWTPPADYTDTSQAYPQPPQRVQKPVADVLQGMDPALAGLLPREMIENAAKPPDPWAGNALERVKTAEGVAGYNPALARTLTAGTPAATLPPVPKPAEPPKPQPMPFTDTLNAFIAAQGYTREQYDALPAERKEAIRQAARAEGIDTTAQTQALVEKYKLQVAQPAPPAEGDRWSQMRLAESNIANISTLTKQVDLSRIGGFFNNALADMARTGQWHGIPIPEALRPTLSDTENRLLTAMDNAADLILRQRSGGQTAETELRRMFAFLATGRATPQSIEQSLVVIQDSLDSQRRIATEKFNANHWLIPEDTTFTRARDVLRKAGKPYDDTAVQIFMRDNPGFR